MSMTIERDRLSPCKDCRERETGCHSTCSLFIEWKEHHEKVIEAIRADKGKTFDANSFLAIQRRKYKKSIDRIPKKGGYRG